MKKKYVAPSIKFINIEQASIMEDSGWFPSAKKNKGSDATEEWPTKSK